MHVVTLLSVGSAIVGAAIGELATGAAPAKAISPQTLTDPVGDNCRNYDVGVGIRTFCGPDITRAAFSTPGDGSLHVDVTYASLPSDALGTQSVEYVELGIYPKAATTPSLFALPGTYRVTRTTSQGWTLQTTNGGFKVVGQASVTPRALGIDIAVPLSPLGGDPTAFRYAVNAGNAGETIPEHPDLAPNTGLFDLVGDAAPPPTTPAAPPKIPSTPMSGSGKTAGLRALTIPSRQRGGAISGRLDVTGPGGDLAIDALVPGEALAPRSKPRRRGAKKSRLRRVAKKPKLHRIAKLTKRGVRAGTVRFRLSLQRSIRRKLAGRTVRVTLRISLRPRRGKTVTQSRTVRLAVPRPR